jgi:hypothetical protein
LGGPVSSYPIIYILQRRGMPRLYRGVIAKRFFIVDILHIDGDNDEQ